MTSAYRLQRAADLEARADHLEARARELRAKAKAIRREKDAAPSASTRSRRVHIWPTRLHIGLGLRQAETRRTADFLTPITRSPSR